MHKKECLSSKPPYNEKKIVKSAQNRRCTSLILELSLCSVCIKSNENIWSYRLQKLGTPKVLWTARWMDRRSGPTTRPVLPKMTQVKTLYKQDSHICKICLPYNIPMVFFVWTWWFSSRFRLKTFLILSSGSPFLNHL